MQSPADKLLIAESAGRLYGGGQRIWDPQDRWNSYKRSIISEFSEQHARPLLAQAQIVLDAGCGSERYTWLPHGEIGFDRFLGQLKTRSRAVVGDLVLLPFKAESIDFVVCVASVLNYVSAVEAISEFSRVLRPGGHLLLHYETSTSFEHILRSRWGSSVVRINTINSGRDDTLWIYRPSYIAAVLANTKFEIKQKRAFHIASTLGLRFGLGQQWSARLAGLDRFFQALRTFADDVIILAEKHA
jgi:SAM-dependent methyltransferase